MDPSEVMKGIEHFFVNVIPGAKCCSDWSEGTISNAFQWAKFCEQVYHVYEDSQTKQKLDELLHNIISFQLIGRHICFEDLGQSSRILCEAFSENQGIDKDLLTVIPGDVKETIAKREKDTELDNLCLELLEALKPIKLMNSKRSLYFEVKAEIYLHLLRDLTLHLASEDEVEKHLSDALQKLVRSENVTMLLHVLALGVPKDESSFVEIQEFAINWTVLNVLSGENQPIGRLFWKDPMLLRAVSLNSPTFLNFYLDFITNCASSLSYEFEDGEMKWIPKGFNASNMSLDEVLTHFRGLLKEDDDVGESTKKYLLNLLENYPNVQIYKEIFTRVT